MLNIHSRTRNAQLRLFLEQKSKETDMKGKLIRSLKSNFGSCKSPASKVNLIQDTAVEAKQFANEMREKINDINFTELLLKAE